MDILPSPDLFVMQVEMDLYTLAKKVSTCKSIVGVASTKQQLLGKLCKLWLSFLVCNYVTYRRIFWQSIGDFLFPSSKSHFFKTPILGGYRLYR